MSGPRPTRVLIADDHPVFRSGLAYEIGRRTSLTLVAEAADGVEAIVLARAHVPDVAVLDMRMPRLNGLRVIEALRAAGTGTRVLILSAFRDRQSIYDVMAAGASGYLAKDTARDAICDAIEAIAGGAKLVDSTLQSELLTELQLRGRQAGASLSQRELEVLTLTAEGLSSAEIGRRLYIGPSTVKTHLDRIAEKLGVRGRTAAVAEALRRGLLD
jgi:two-component system, NarL family, nitrate/nitrite response regulator NarL